MQKWRFRQQTILRDTPDALKPSLTLKLLLRDTSETSNKRLKDLANAGSLLQDSWRKFNW